MCIHTRKRDDNQRTTGLKFSNLSEVDSSQIYSVPEFLKVLQQQTTLTEVRIMTTATENSDELREYTE
jgi:hypothetical protein